MNDLNDWKDRLTKGLEPLLSMPDPRPRISAYDNLPFAIFLYPPEREFAVQEETARLATRLLNRGKRVTTVSLAERLWTALEREGYSIDELAEAERDAGWDAMATTLHDILRKTQPLEDLVAEQIPEDAKPGKDIVLIVRAGALFPFYRTSALLENLHGLVQVPTVLCYPGTLEGPSGLRFMGTLDPEHNYRPKIF
jgi:hypothetical protein